MAEHELLAERLVGYATSTLLRDLPQMRRDLMEASERLTAYGALLEAWKAVFRDCEADPDSDRLKPHLIQQFAELFTMAPSIEATAPSIEARKHRLRPNVVISDDSKDVPPEDQP
jgi:hypothetical protein